MIDGDWRDGGFRQRRPSVETLAWVAASMGWGSRIVGYRRLTGGVCSAVNRLTVERRGMRTFVVLRKYPGGLACRGAWRRRSPTLLWWREAGSRFRASWLLMLLVLRRGARHRC